MEAYAGIDLHSSNNYIGVIDGQGRRLYAKRLPNSINQILVALEPFKENLEAVLVESSYNRYWLVDGLQQKGYKVHLANPSATHNWCLLVLAISCCLYLSFRLQKAQYRPNIRTIFGIISFSINRLEWPDPFRISDRT